MSDRPSSTTLEPVVGYDGSDVFSTAVKKIQKDIHLDISQKEALSLNDILTKVLDWEEEYYDKVHQDEIEALQTLSLMLGMVKFDVERRQDNRPAVRLENINIEHEVLKNVFNNLDAEGKPNKVIARSFGLVTAVFDELLYYKHEKVSDKGASTRFGIWTGVMGMSTVALMFNSVGWEVALPDPELDLKYEADLIVRNKNGEVYVVDVTARTPASDKTLDNESSLFFVNKEESREELKQIVDGLKGTIRVNVPSLISRESEDFYADRKTGFPNDKSLEKFKSLI